MGHNGGPPDPPDNRPVWAERPCPECGVLHKPRQAGTLFCCPAHRDAWNNRQTVRGRVLTRYVIAARITRDGTRGTPDQRAYGRKAAQIMRRLINRYRDEDRAVGRMDMADFIGRLIAEQGEPD
jgi:hypothetical protein